MGVCMQEPRAAEYAQVDSSVYLSARLTASCCLSFVYCLHGCIISVFNPHYWGLKLMEHIVMTWIKVFAGEEGYVRETHSEIGRATCGNVIVEQLCWKCFTHLISLHIKTVVVLSFTFIVLLSFHFPFVLCYHCQSVIPNQLQLENSNLQIHCDWVGEYVATMLQFLSLLMTAFSGKPVLSKSLKMKLHRLSWCTLWLPEFSDCSSIVFETWVS